MSHSALFQNAVQSIEVGVEDYEAATADPRRAVSAVRNFYAGVLLMMKERLQRLDPELIYVRLKPVLVEGAVAWVGDGRSTVDFRTLEQRWTSLGWSAEWKRLRDLQRIRNDIEHFEVKAPTARIRQALSDTFVLVAAVLTEHLKEAPAQVFSAKAWETMLREAEVHKQLADGARRSRTSITCPTGAETALLAHVRCPACGSELLRSTGRGDYPEAVLVCDACGEEPTVQEVLPEALAEEHSWGTYVAAKEGGDDPLGTCPHCFEDSFVVDEGHCVLCEQGLDYTECIRCSESLSLDDQDFDGLCGYCAHVAGRDD